MNCKKEAELLDEAEKNMGKVPAYAKVLVVGILMPIIWAFRMLLARVEQLEGVSNASE